jgi:hypothetical protein
MLDDYPFRELHIQQAWDRFVEAHSKADWSPSQKHALAMLANYITELDRVIQKEEGRIVRKL